MTETQETAPRAAPPPDDPGSSARRRRWPYRVAAAFAVLVAGLAAGLYAALDRPVNAPPWVREKIEARLAEALPGISVDFGRVSLLVQRSGLARVILWDVEIRNAQGGLVAQLSDIEAGLSPAALLTGKVALREAQVSGAFLTLQRDRDGKIGLALGDAFADGADVPDLATMIARVDAVALDPRLSGLRLFDADALTIRYEDRRALRGWTADGGRVRLTREAGRLKLTADVALLSGGDGVATLEVAAESPIGQPDLAFGVTLHDLASSDIATQSPALTWLEALDAPISGSLRSAFDAEGTLGEMFATLEIGTGVLQPRRETRPIPFDSVATTFRYAPEAGLLSFDGISVVSPLGKVEASGTAQLDSASGNLPTGMTGQFVFDGVSLAEGTVLERPLDLIGAQVAFKLGLAPFRVDLGELRITDPEFPVSASGQLQAGDNGWALALDLRVAETNPRQVLSFWPRDLAPETRRWVGGHVKEGRILDAVIGVRAKQDTRPDLFFDMSFDAAHVDYSVDLPAITQGKGRLAIHQGRLGLRVDEGLIDMGGGGAVDLTGSAFIIPNLRQDPPLAEIRLDARGPLKAFLSYLDNDSWQLLRRQGKDADMATGHAEARGRMLLPLKRNLRLADIRMEFDGRIDDVESFGTVPDRRLTAQTLDVALNNKQLEITGAAEVDAVPVEGRFVLPFDNRPSRVSAQVTLTPQGLENFGIALPEGMVRGTGRGDLDIEIPDGAPPRFALETDLAGLALSIPQIGWSLPASARGRFDITGRLRDPVEIGELRLSGNGLQAEGQLVLGAGNSFDRLELVRLRVADWMNVTGRLRGRGDSPPRVEITSGEVDLRKAPFGAGGPEEDAAGGGSPLALNLGALQVTDSIVLEQFRGDFVNNRGLEGRFEALLGGGAQVSGQVIPQPSGSAFRITGEDAGDILRDADMLKTVQDGTFRMDLAPVGGQPGSFDGFLEIKGTRLQKAPAIASLLDAVSIVGLLDQLNGPGVFFSDVEARFRLTPSRVVISRSSAVGPSMGISMDGYYDLEREEMDMQGVLSPIYVVNAIGRLISRQGEGLIGFNFNLRGTVASPRVAVNPLSIFTPGMFRDIFRRPPPRLSQ